LRGEYKFKEMNLQSSRYVNKLGIGFQLKEDDGGTHLLDLKGFLIKEVGAYCGYCEDVVHHTRECPIATLPSPTLLLKFKSSFEGTHYLLKKTNDGRVKAKFIGIHAKGKLPKKIWVPKTHVNHYKKTKFALGTKEVRGS